MLDLLRRQRSKPPDGPDEPGDGAPRSHVFPRFLKRLAGRDRPALLDLGRVSGSNIEIFARLGCRVQVEDLVTAAEEAGAPEPAAATGLPAIHERPAPAAGGAPPATATAAASPAPGPAATPGASAARPGAPAGAAPGARPSRHIVLPPRTFGRVPPPGSAGASGARGAAAPPRTPLATSFRHADDAFDAIVGWDLFNYYDPESARRIAGETVRVLKSGGLVFATFHARRADAPDGPRRHRIVDETHIIAEPHSGRPLPRYLYQNRDIEKMFAGLRIVELYFLRHGVREMLLEKRGAGSSPAPAAPHRPAGRFRID